MFEDNEEDEEFWESPYENGHWEWDTNNEELKFISNVPPLQKECELSTTVIHAIEFKDDIDLWEQQKFKKRFQRKMADDDFVTLQDVRDVVLFTAPSSILSPAVINMLHLPTTERFLRALILCCQYYLQILEAMNHRTLETETKVRTDASEEVESKYRDDMEDLRLLVANEYCIIILGGEEFAKYHHMGKTKRRSLSKKEAILFETMTSIAIQIVWIALNRKYYTQIEVEVNRILKTDFYNSAVHKKAKWITQLNHRERLVLEGHCVLPRRKLNTCSPLINEVFCNRNISYSLYGLGSIKYSGLSTRLRYLESVLSAPEHMFGQLGLSLGILGLPRAGFDIMLREVKNVTSASTSSASLRQSMSRLSRASRISRKSTMTSTARKKLYADIFIPQKGQIAETLSDHFPSEMLPKLPSNNEQRLKWLRRISSKSKKSRH